jgi:hypothetical protein
LRLIKCSFPPSIFTWAGRLALVLPRHALPSNQDDLKFSEREVCVTNQKDKVNYVSDECDAGVHIEQCLSKLRGCAPSLYLQPTLLAARRSADSIFLDVGKIFATIQNLRLGHSQQVGSLCATSEHVLDRNLAAVCRDARVFHGPRKALGIVCFGL